MIKKLIKFLSIILFIFVVLIIYLSFVGVNTSKFNKKIINKISTVNKKINLDLKDVRFLLNLRNFTLRVSTNDPLLLLDGKSLQIKDIKTNISLRSLILDEFLLDDLQISTKSIALNEVVLLARSLKNSTELLLLNNIIKNGFLIAEIKLNFNNEGKIVDDYQINGLVENGEFNLLNQLYANNLNFGFNIYKKKYSITGMKATINDIKLSSSLLEIDEQKNLFFIKGKFLTSEKDFNKDQLSSIFSRFLKNIDLKKVRFSSENNLSFNINKKLKFNDLNIESIINLKELVLKNNLINLNSYLPNLKKQINFENHKIKINYNNNQLEINGNGEVLIESKPDTIDYRLAKNKNEFIFDSKINIKNSKLLINFLNYEKQKNLDAQILIKGNYRKNNSMKFDLISLMEKNNKILFKNINLDKDFKIISVDNFDFNYLNKKKIKNKLILNKDKLNYTIEGESFDASKLINKIMNNKDENSSLFSKLNCKINLKINKTYIDEVNFVNNLSGEFNFVNNEIKYLNLKSFFPNNKKISLLIDTNNKQEKTTKLFTGYPKPLIKRYDFIKGFDEGYLDFYSVKKDGISNSLLIIDDFKVKEVPVFARILSLASLQGIADLLTGEGIRFTDFEMKFSNKKGLMTIEEMYAIGPAVSILMKGYIESQKLISLRGTLVPATTINRTIASIPLLGNILVGKKVGEGVFGVSFKIKGPPKDLSTTVNPVKTLTPRFITRTLEKIKNN
jgi:hypothetical protein